MSNASERVSARELEARGIIVNDKHLIFGSLEYEGPVYVFGHRLKDCSIGAFVFFNAAGTISAYRCRLGRFAQVGENCIVGPPEHPQDWFSNHPITFTRPKYTPNFYRLPDFARWAPDEQDGPSYVDTVPSETIIGHDTYTSVGSFVKRGVTIGDGALVGAHSVVTRDIPPYAVAVGAPARVVRMRYPEKIVERFLRLQWWKYDLAPFKNQVDFSKVEATLDFFEQKLADGELKDFRPDAYRLTPEGDAFQLEKLPTPIHFP
ncbi:MAG: CatB-related O-acetyltransferase [Panacagrimonas sp.]